jgi:hypothetical protein
MTHPMNEVFGRPNVFASRDPLIAALAQRLGEPFEQMAALAIV